MSLTAVAISILRTGTNTPFLTFPKTTETTNSHCEPQAKQSCISKEWEGLFRYFPQRNKNHKQDCFVGLRPPRNDGSEESCNCLWFFIANDRSKPRPRAKGVVGRNRLTAQPVIASDQRKPKPRAEGVAGSNHLYHFEDVRELSSILHPKNP